MWQWLTDNSIGIFVASVLVLVISYVVREFMLHRLGGMLPKDRFRHVQKNVGITLSVIIVLSLVMVIVSFIALVSSRQGMDGFLNPAGLEAWFLEHGVIILFLLLVAVILWAALNRFLPSLIYRSLHRPKRGESMQGMKKRADTLVGVFVGLGKVIVVVVIALMILSESGVQIAPILAGLGIAGIAVGFGAQYLIRDLIAGVFLIMENQYRVGDVANVGGVTGIVEEVNLRKTVLRDLDGVVHHVPNGEIKIASNYTRHFSRINLDVPVSYSTNLNHAISVINRVGQELAADENWREQIISPPQVLRVNNFGDSGIDIKIVGDTKPLQQWALMGQLRMRLKEAFDEEGIEIPWPHVKLYFGETKAAEPATCKDCGHQNLPGSKYCSNCGTPINL